MITFQVRLLTWALWELRVLEKDFVVLGIDPRMILERGRKKQLAALHEAFNALGVDWRDDRNYAASTLKAATEFIFPTDDTKASKFKQFEAAWSAFWNKEDLHDDSEFDVHRQHQIKTVHGIM